MHSSPLSPPLACTFSSFPVVIMPPLPTSLPLFNHLPLYFFSPFHRPSLGLPSPCSSISAFTSFTFSVSFLIALKLLILLLSVIFVPSPSVPLFLKPWPSLTAGTCARDQYGEVLWRTGRRDERAESMTEKCGYSMCVFHGDFQEKNNKN